MWKGEGAESLTKTTFIQKINLIIETINQNK